VIGSLILHRIRKHFQTHDWFSASIDVVVVFLGVLFATQLSISIEKIADKRDLAASMDSLSEEINDALLPQKNNLHIETLFLKRIREALAILDGADPSGFEEEDIFGALSMAGDPKGKWKKRYVTLEALRSADRIKDVPYGDLRSMLLQLIDVSEENQSQLLLDQGAIDPLYFEFITREVSLEDSWKWGMSMVIDIDWNAARESPEFKERLLQLHDASTFLARVLHYQIRLSEDTLDIMAEKGFTGVSSYWSKRRWCYEETSDAALLPEKYEDWSDGVDFTCDRNLTP
jgi:hypothetical protein